MEMASRMLKVSLLKLQLFLRPVFCSPPPDAAVTDSPAWTLPPSTSHPLLFGAEQDGRALPLWTIQQQSLKSVVISRSLVGVLA